MTRKILTLNMKRKIVPKPVEKLVKAVFHQDPQKRFLNGVAINPDQLIQLELGSKQLSMRYINRCGGCIAWMQFRACRVDTCFQCFLIDKDVQE